MLSKVTLLVWTHGAYLPVLKGDKLVDGDLLLIEGYRIERIERLVETAWNAGLLKRDWDASDRNLIDAIPQLKHCGALGILRLSAACRVLRQSHKALGNDREVIRHTANIEYLSQVYATTGAY